VSLGCDKNRVDTENMLYYLSSGQYEITPNEADADVIIVNTCAFIESARVESIDAILEAAKQKTDGKCKKLVVTGCLSEKYRKNLEQELPEVDAFLGVREYEKILNVIEDGAVKEKTDGRILTTLAHFSYLRIADGCDNHCTFCTIPSIRGKYTSVPIEELVEQAQKLADDGVKELILIAQDTTSYGKDIYGKPMLVELIKELSKLDIDKMRLMYCYPELVSDALIDEIANNPKVAKYIDVPLQHINDGILKLMNRKSRKAEICALITKLRDKCPQIAIRTTFMVGFPSETDEQFNELCDFVKEYKLEHVGIFAYSKEDDTPSAKLKGQIPARTKLKRVKILGELNEQNVIEYNKSQIGKTLEVVYEDIDYERGLFVGRTEQNAPDIDTLVYFSGDFADVGNKYYVKITGYDGYDLIGEMI
jgi:ribosomal protein S12 methylthiotransferase